MIIDGLESELRSLSDGIKLRIHNGELMEHGLGFVFGRPLNVYFGELADRLHAARKEMEAALREPTPYDKPRIGDRCVVLERWEAVITAYTVRASGQTEYQLEWIGDGELKSDWLTLERMRLLGVKLSRDGKEVWL